MLYQEKVHRAKQSPLTSFFTCAPATAAASTSTATIATMGAGAASTFAPTEADFAIILANKVPPTLPDEENANPNSLQANFASTSHDDDATSSPQ